MIIKKLLLVFVLIILAGCTQSINRTELSSGIKIPPISYEAYFYVEGSRDKSRAVLLKHPDAKIEVAAESAQITPTTATFAQAMAYMNEVRGLRRVNIEVINFKGKPIGYLLAYQEVNQNVLSGSEIHIDLYEMNGKLYFKPRLELDRSY
jgi:hypothetical protein